MTVTARILVRHSVERSTEPAAVETRDHAVELTEAAALPKSEVLSLANGFNALSPPTGAQGVVLSEWSGAVVWTLKGVTGDTGVRLANGTAPTLALVLPLSPVSIGITVTGAASVRADWF